MIQRSLAVSALTLALAVMLGPIAVPAWAGWSADGATIKSTTNAIPKVVATGDGGHGTLVVWQEEATAGSGVLRAQHVLASGDVDPAWPADGAMVCGTVAARPVLGIVPDGLGGAYVWWMQGSTLYLDRFDASGAIPAGWPAPGRVLGALAWSAQRPSAIADGAHGIYVAWTTSTFNADEFGIKGVHVAPDNTGAGGWTGAHLLWGDDPVSTAEYWPQLALAADGGIFIGCAQWSSNPTQVASAFRIRRLTPAGLNAPGWPTDGIALAGFHGEWLNPAPGTGLIGLSADDRGGLFALLGVPTSTDGVQASLETRLFRLQGDGQNAADWPAAGSVMPNGPAAYSDVGADASYRVSPNGLDGANAGVPNYYDHGTDVGFREVSAAGTIGSWFEVAGGLPGLEAVSKTDGGMWVASFHPNGPYGPYEPYANLSLTQSNAPAGWSDFLEIHLDLVVQWYGDIALAPAGDGSVVFFWSQVRDRYGLFARRFNGATQVTGVPPGASPRVLALDRLRFVAGEGVRASLSLAGSDARLELFDVQGRRLSSARLAGSGARQVALPGTADLASGLYFARLADAREIRAGKVVVSR